MNQKAARPNGKRADFCVADSPAGSRCYDSDGCRSSPPPAGEPAHSGTCAMIRAVLKSGVIQPAEPLPVDWTDGQELLVQPSPSDSPTDIDRWTRELDEGAALIAADEFARSGVPS